MNDPLAKKSPGSSLPLRHPDQRVGVFIDTQNLYHSARSLFNSNVNYKNLVEGAVGNRKLMRAFAYVIKSDTTDESKFFEALTDLGIETRVKDLQIFYSGEKKADWDVGIAMDIVRLSEKIDTVVLVSGDGDFLEVLRYVKSRGIRAEVMAFKKTTSAKLLEETDDFIDLGGEGGKFLIPQGKSARMNSNNGAPVHRPTTTNRPAPTNRPTSASRPAAANRPTIIRPAVQRPASKAPPRSRWMPRKNMPE